MVFTKCSRMAKESHCLKVGMSRETNESLVCPVAPPDPQCKKNENVLWIIHTLRVVPTGDCMSHKKMFSKATGWWEGTSLPAVFFSASLFWIVRQPLIYKFRAIIPNIIYFMNAINMWAKVTKAKMPSVRDDILPIHYSWTFAKYFFLLHNIRADGISHYHRQR